MRWKRIIEAPKPRTSEYSTPKRISFYLAHQLANQIFEAALIYVAHSGFFVRALSAYLILGLSDLGRVEPLAFLEVKEDKNGYSPMF